MTPKPLYLTALQWMEAAIGRAATVNYLREKNRLIKTYQWGFTDSGRTFTLKVDALSDRERTFTTEWGNGEYEMRLDLFPLGGFQVANTLPRFVYMSSYAPFDKERWRKKPSETTLPTGKT